MPNVVEVTVKADNKIGAGMNEAAKDAEGAARKIGNAADDMEKQVKGMGERIGTAGKAVAAGAGLAIGGALVSGFSSSLEFDSANAKLKAQLGGSAKVSGDMGKVAGNLYANAYGSSLGEVSDAVASVVQSGALMEGATTSQIKSITGQAMSMAGAFGIDVPRAMQAVSRMVKTGMVPDAQAGLNLITVAFQKLGPGAEDVLDTFTEYSSQFQKIGISGPEAMGLIKQMMDGGARSTDLAADALKEFSIRAIDGSKTTADGMRILGLNADDMAKKFAAGGQTANDAFQVVIDKLKAVPNPVLRSRAAVALFGTQAEDLGSSLLAIDPSKATAGLGKLADASKKVDSTMSGDAQSKITGMQRHMEQLLASVVNAPGILGTAGSALAAFGGGAVQSLSQMSIIAVAMPDRFKAMALSAVQSFGRMVAAAIAYTAASVAGGIAAAAAWVTANIAMIAATGGIILVIGAVIAIVILLIKHWDDVKAAATAVWEAVKAAWDAIWGAITSVVSAIIEWVKANWPLLIAIVLGPLGIIIGLVIQNWDRIKAVFMAGVNAVIGAAKWLAQLPGIVIGFIVQMVTGAINKAGELVGWFRGLPGRLIGALGDLGRMLLDVGKDIIMGIWHGLENGWNWLVDKVKNLARSLLDAAKSALHIGSPSKDFADKFGAMIPAGAAVGIERSAVAARRAVQDMSAGLLNTGNAGAYRSAVAQASPAIRTALGQATQNVRLEVATNGTAVSEFLARLLRDYVKVNGGDVQQVFGR